MKNLMISTLVLMTWSLCKAQSWNWAHQYGGGYNTAEEAKNIGRDQFGNLYLTAHANHFTGGSGGASVTYPLLYKLSSSGAVIWSDTLPDYVTKSVTDNFGNTYIIGGFFGNWVSKFDSNGQQQWGQYLPYSTLLNDLQLALGGGIVVATTLVDTVSATGWIYRIDGSGTVLWQKATGLLNCYLIDCSPNGQIYAIGNDQSSSYLSMYDNAANPMMSVPVSTNVTRFAVAPDKSIFLISQSLPTFNNNMISTITISKYSAQLQMTWNRYCSGSGYFLFRAVAVDQLNSVFVTGTFEQTMSVGANTLSCVYNKLFLASFDQSGNLGFAINSTGPGGGIPADMLIFPGNNVIFAGAVGGETWFGSDTIPGAEYSDLFTAKLQYSNLTNISQPDLAPPLHLFPSPCKDKVYFRLENSLASTIVARVYDSAGKLLRNDLQLLRCDMNQYEINVSDLAQGMYLIETEISGNRYCSRLIIE